MEEVKGEDKGGRNGGQALVMWESSWCTTSVAMVNLLPHISRVTG